MVRAPQHQVVERPPQLSEFTTGSHPALLLTPPYSSPWPTPHPALLLTLHYYSPWPVSRVDTILCSKSWCHGFILGGGDTRHMDLQMFL